VAVSIESAIGERVAELKVLDPLAERVQAAVGRLLPPGTPQKDLLSGRWLGHPLHPLLTDVVIGSWLGAGVLDVCGPPAHRAADRLVALGVLAALPTATAGLADWADLSDQPRRVGATHALGNVTAVTLFAASWCARASGHRRAGVVLSGLGTAVAAASAWLGGHLTYTRGVGVNRTAFESVKRSWQDLVAEDQVKEGVLVEARAGDVPILLVRDGERIHAMSGTCSHLGCLLHKGSLVEGTVVCPCHGSAFALDGTVVRGPATASQPSLDVRVKDGQVQVRRRSPTA
jgi:nitrite reductase/ring-hydroxylating ferredoxin subunit